MMIKPSGKVEKMILQWESFGNSMALYCLLGMIILTLWSVFALTNPAFELFKEALGRYSLIFLGISITYGFFWWVITREKIKLPPTVKRSLSTTLRLVRPLHTMTGFLGVGFALLHGISYFGSDSLWNLTSMTGIIASITALLLGIDGIGLLMSPYLSRSVHRAIAVVFMASLFVHLALIM